MKLLLSMTAILFTMQACDSQKTQSKTSQGIGSTYWEHTGLDQRIVMKSLEIVEGAKKKPNGLTNAYYASELYNMLVEVNFDGGASVPVLQCWRTYSDARPVNMSGCRLFRHNTNNSEIVLDAATDFLKLEDQYNKAKRLFDTLEFNKSFGAQKNMIKKSKFTYGQYNLEGIRYKVERSCNNRTVVTLLQCEKRGSTYECLFNPDPFWYGKDACSSLAGI